MKTTESIKTTVKTSKLVMTAIIAMSCLPGNAFAATVALKDIVQVTSYTQIGSTQNGTIDDTINGDGLSSALNTGDAVPGVLPTHNNIYTNPLDLSGVRWFVEAQNTPITDITFNLGAAYDLGAVLFWNYAETGNTDRGISSVTASFSSDGLSFTGDTTLNFAETSGDPLFVGETVSMLSEDVQYVKFTDFVNHGDSVLAGFSEIRFATVPEPSSTALLGLGGLTLLLRRKRS